MKKLLEIITTPVVAIAAAGNLVAVFVLVLYGVVRSASLTALGVSPDRLLPQGALILNFQMSGMLLGGVLWGILGDKIGRRSVLVSSIVLYTLASFANALVPSVEWYAPLRFIAGFGLAGEFGAAIALLSEALPRSKRAYGASVVAAAGMIGAVGAAQAGHHLNWQLAYGLGGILGIGVLLLRSRLDESHLFTALDKSIPRGSIQLLFRNRRQVLKYARCILIGVPVWFVAGLLMIFAPEFARAQQISEPVIAGTAIMSHCIGAFFGNLLAGYLSHHVAGRKMVISGFLVLMGVFYALFLSGSANSASEFYTFCVLSGLAAGYFGLFATVAAEQFGTNLRSTVSTTVPNLVRGMVVPITLLFQILQRSIGVNKAAAILGGALLVIAAIALIGIDESHNHDLDFVEK